VIACKLSECKSFAIGSDFSTCCKSFLYRFYIQGSAIFLPALREEISGRVIFVQWGLCQSQIDLKDKVAYDVTCSLNIIADGC